MARRAAWALCAALLACAPRPPPAPEALPALRADLTALAVEWLDADQLRRADGFTYAVDLAHLMLHAAHLGDRPLYLRLRQMAVERLIIDRADDPYTQGFVGWRFAPGAPADAALDASGTTEALRLTRALWTGARAFARPEDHALAERLAHGYCRHATVEGGVWLVRNYFNLGTRAFANDSFLVDYDADLLAEMARETGDPTLAEVAAASTRTVRAARTPAGLVHTLIQPDVATVMPDLPLTAFSPNDVVQLNNACTVATTVVTEAPEVARAVLDFGTRRRADLKRYFYGRTGEAVNAVAADLTTTSCLARLAAQLGDRSAERAWVSASLPGWRGLRTDPERRVYSVTEALLALDAVLEPAGGSHDQQ